MSFTLQFYSQVRELSRLILIISLAICAEHEVIPGRAIPSECHVEAHTDYSGVAVRWGLTHHVNSAADCCQACLDQARNATEEQKKCNVWVYCPSEGGCHSPDKYTHKNHECWLKQVKSRCTRNSVALLSQCSSSSYFVKLYIIRLLEPIRVKFIAFWYISMTWGCASWQADEPQISFKGHYDEEYRQQHPTAPSIVPWVSGVVS